VTKWDLADRCHRPGAPHAGSPGRTCAPGEDRDASRSPSGAFSERRADDAAAGLRPTHAYSDGRPYPYADAHADGDAETDIHTHVSADAHAHAHRDADADTDTHAHALGAGCDPRVFSAADQLEGWVVEDFLVPFVTPQAEDETLS
jgi:hypothetical protein